MNYSRKLYPVFLAFAYCTLSLVALFLCLFSTNAVRGQDSANPSTPGQSVARRVVGLPLSPVDSIRRQPDRLVEIIDFQVTQGVQTPESGVPLIRDFYNLQNFKPTIARVAARSTNSFSLPVVIQVTYVFSMPAQWEIVEFKSDPVETVLSNRIPSFEDEDLPTIPLDFSEGWWHRQYASSVTVWIDVLSVDSPQRLLAQSAKVQYPIVDSQSPQVFYYPIRFPGETQPEMSTISSTTAAAFVRSVFPVVDNIDFYRAVPYDAFTCPVYDADGDKNIDPIPQTKRDPSTHTVITYPAETCTILHHLDSIRNGLVTDGTGPDPLTFVYGWVAGNPMVGANGYGSQNGRVAFGNSLAERGQRTFAHELMHNLSLPHLVDGTIQHPGWDAGGILPSNDIYWQNNAITSLAKPSTLFDITAPGKNTNQAWISPATYNAIRQVLDVSQSTAASGGTYAASICVFEEDSGEYTAYIFPVTRWPWSLQPIPTETASDAFFTVEFSTSSGETSSSVYDARIGADPEDPERDIVTGQYFIAANALNLATTGDIIEVRITAPNGSPVRIYDPVTRTSEETLINRYPDQSFVVNITSPQPNDIAGQVSIIAESTFTVEWTLDDELGRSVRTFEYQVLYSHDGGGIWMPLAVNLPGDITSVLVKGNELCTTVDNFPSGTTRVAAPIANTVSLFAPAAANADPYSATGIIRVLASDGFRTESSDISVSVVGLVSDYCQRGILREGDPGRQDDGKPTATPTALTTAVPTAAEIVTATATIAATSLPILSPTVEPTVTPSATSPLTLTLEPSF